MTPLLAQRLRTDRSFERLYRRHVADVYHYALAVCRNPADAEDVTQTTFMNAYRAVQRGEEPRTPKNWLLAIAHNVMRQRFRATARRPSEVEFDDQAIAAVPDETGYSAEDIRRGLSELPFNQRSALVMRELEGRSYAEIAEILGVTVGAVETLIFRARRALREQLEGSLTCTEAELAISRQIDGRLSRAEKGALRAHLRTCSECASFARSQRAQRSALKGLVAIPLPASLTSLFGGGGAAVGTTVAAKTAAVTALGLLVAGGSVETARQVRHHAKPATPAAHVRAPESRAVVSGAPVAHAVVQHTAPASGLKIAATQTHARHQGTAVAHVSHHARGVVGTSVPVVQPARGAPAEVVPSSGPPASSNGARGRRAHGAPATLRPSRPVTPPAAVAHAQGRPAHKAAPASTLTQPRGRAVGHSTAPGLTRGHGNGNGNGNATPASPMDETPAASEQTDTVAVPVPEP